MTTDAALLRKILHTLGRPTQAELDAGLAAVARMEGEINDLRGLFTGSVSKQTHARTVAQLDAAKKQADDRLTMLRRIEWYYSPHSGWTCVVCGVSDAYKEHDLACLLGNFMKEVK